MITSMHFGASKELILQARQLRLRMTPAEVKLWEHIRNKSLGHKFRNQHPIYKYVVDFYCHDLKLAIEVDGDVHNDPGNAIDDAHREEHLRGIGLTILRFSNEEIFNSINEVMTKIRETISVLSIPSRHAG